MAEKMSRSKIDKRWKADEDYYCKDLGLKRLGHIRRGVACADGENDVFSVDITESKGLKFLDKELIDAQAHTSGDRLPLVITRLLQKDRGDAIVSMRYRDFRAWFGGG